MNDPTDHPIDVAEERTWLLAHKHSTGSSWTELARSTGVPHGTLSSFGGETYGGDNERIARQIFRYRQHLASQAELDIEAPEIPGFIDTPTSKRLVSILRWGHRGRVVVAAMGPGTGKTETCRHYRDCHSNVWLTTMKPSTANMNNMQIELLSVLGEKDAHGGSQQLSRRIVDRVRGTGGLILFDEAQHLTEKAIEEIRSWHDETGVGVALIGNATVVGRLEGGSRKAAYAQLYSRVAMRHIQNLPLEGDALAIADAWGVTNAKQRAFVVKISQMPGGLRSVTMMLELGTMIAASERKALELSHLNDAWAQLATRPLAA